jgi:hypothetical protein
MKKPKPPRARVKPSQPQPQPPQPPDELPHGSQQAQQRRLRSILSVFDRTFRNLWFYIAVAIAVISLWHAYRPEISIGVGATVQNDPVATLFTLANTGSWTLYNVTTKCAVWNGYHWFTSKGNMILAEPNAALAGNSNIDILT